MRNGTLMRTFVQDGLTLSEVEFRPDEGFPLCLGYMVGDDDGHSALWPTPEDAIEVHKGIKIAMREDKADG